MTLESRPFTPHLVNPIEVIGFVSIEHIIGHIVFGMFLGVVTLSLRYVVLGGFFALLVDADRVLNILDILAFPRMAHSIPFAILAAVVMMLVFGKKDLKLISISFAAIFIHISFDILSGRSGSFLLFTPFFNTKFYFPELTWIYFFLLSIAIVGVFTLITKRITLKQRNKERLTKN